MAKRDKSHLASHLNRVHVDPRQFICPTGPGLHVETPPRVVNKELEEALQAIHSFDPFERVTQVDEEGPYVVLRDADGREVGLLSHDTLARLRGEQGNR